MGKPFAIYLNGRIIVDNEDPYYNFSSNDRRRGNDAVKINVVHVNSVKNLEYYRVIPHLVGYSDANHKWGLFDVENMSEVVYDEDAFDILCLGTVDESNIKQRFKNIILNKKNLNLMMLLLVKIVA